MEEGDLKVNYEQELQNLKKAQKNAAVADLQEAKNNSLSNLAAEEAKIKPEYAAQRSTMNANNRVAARNFQEYLANTGRANSGIGAQYEMSRQNNLQSGLNAINTAETQSLADIARRRTDTENAYNTGLAGASERIEANYIQNLLDQKQKQWEREFAQKQFDEQVRQYNQNRQYQLNRAFSSGGGSGVKKTGNTNSQPDNVNGQKVQSSGYKVSQLFGKGNVNSNNENIDDLEVYKVGNSFYIWDSYQGKYINVDQAILDKANGAFSKVFNALKMTGGGAGRNF